MPDYYLSLALRSFRRNKVLTALMVLALGLGIGASITTLTVLKLLSGDPLPQKSARLFTPELNPLSASQLTPNERTRPPFANLLSYTDAMNLMQAHETKRQVALALTSAKISPQVAGRHPFFSDAVMTTADFFSMFNVPFEYGSGWGVEGGESRARVAVISEALNNKLFGGKNSVGRTLRVNDHDYRISGVVKHWAPQPKFYALDQGEDSYGSKGDAIFLPLQSALADRMSPNAVACWRPADIRHLEAAPCAIVSMWVELANASDAREYKTFLSNYAQQQISLGRFHSPNVWLPDLMGFLAQQQVVPNDASLQTYLAFGFLLICIVGTVGLLLAKCLGRTREIGLRRALGATRGEIFQQFMVESGMVGIAGGVLGLIFVELGLMAIRHQPVPYAKLAHLHPEMFVATFVVALIASLIAGLLPAWRACAVEPAPQLKSI